MALTPPPANPAAPGSAPSRAVRATFAGLADAAWSWLFVTFWPYVSGFRTWYAGTAAPELEALQTDVAAKQGTASAAATTATTQAGLAASSAAAAAADLVSVAAILDAFDDRMLGAKAADPALDNDGNALQDGAWYINTVSGLIRAYTTAGGWVNGIAGVAGVSSFNGQVGAVTFAPGVTVAASRNSNTQLVAADVATLIPYSGGTFAQTVAAVATLGTVWEAYLWNLGTGVVTLTPTGAELVDGLASFAIYPGELRKVYRDGAGLKSIVLKPFTLTPAATLNFIEPPGYSSYEVFMQAPGGGGGGGRRGAASATRGGGGSGGGGGSIWATVKAGAPGTSITLTVGADGTGGAGATVNDTSGSPGTAGGTHSFGTLLSAGGGGAGLGGTGGSGGAAGAGVSAPGGPVSTAGTSGVQGGSSGAIPTNGGDSTTWGATGGGAGAGISAGNVPTNGARAGNSGTVTTATQFLGGTGGVSGGASNGTDGAFDAPSFRGGTGGGGGASHLTNAGGNGGAGKRGGGGGGGGGATNGANAGNGGNGGPGFYYVGGNL